MTKEPLTCPFCGGELTVFDDQHEGPTVLCESCVMDAGHFKSLEDLREKLTRRSGTDLLTCPCCGGVPEEVVFHGRYMVRCRRCLIDVGLFDRRADMVVTWNMRRG